MGTVKSKAGGKDKSSKSSNGSGSSRAVGSTTSSARSSSQTSSRTSRATSISGSFNGTRARSKSIVADEHMSRPTTAPEGHAPTFGSQLRHNIVPPMPDPVDTLRPSFSRGEIVPSTPPPTGENGRISRQRTFSKLLTSQSTNHVKQEKKLSNIGKTRSNEQASRQTEQPPHITSTLAPSLANQLVTSPTLSSAKSLKRTLTEKLFRRRPSNSRRSIVRAALSDEPEPMPAPPVPVTVPPSPSIPPPRPARSPEPLFDYEHVSASIAPAVESEPPPDRDLAPPRIPSDVERERHASFAALEGGDDEQGSTSIPATTSNAQQAVSAEFDFGLVQSTESVPRVAIQPPQVDTRPEEGNERTNRPISADSASSYGSIGFTERTFSSRSSPPPTDEVTRKISQTIRIESQEGSLAMPAPLRPTATQPMADSPTDPYYLDGRLSDLLAADDEEVENSPTDAEVVQPPQQSTLKRRMSMESFSSEEDELSSIPMASFRPRKDSLAGAPPPLFSSSERKLSRPSVGEAESRMALEEVRAIKGRQDSFTSVRSGFGGVKGVCRGCAQTILSTQKSVSSADGRLSGKYHKECFVCQSCSEPFATAEFYVHHDQPYCAHHYHQLEDSLCATCGRGIEGLYMETANVAGRGQEKHHPGCLKCSTCQMQLTDDYFELSGKVYCERDAFRLAKHPRVHSRGPPRPSPLVREYIRSGDPGAIKGANFPERRTNRVMMEAG